MKQLWRLVLSFTLLIVLAATLIVAGCTRGPATGPKDPGGQRDDPLELARDFLSKSTDLNAARSALQQINRFVGDHPDQRPPALTAEQRALLAGSQVNLTPDELAEVESNSFTLLDGYHLDLCFLLRDAAQALDLEGRLPAE